jgi:hypothetical protein
VYLCLAVYNKHPPKLRFIALHEFPGAKRNCSLFYCPYSAGVAAPSTQPTWSAPSARCYPAAPRLTRGLEGQHSAKTRHPVWPTGGQNNDHGHETNPGYPAAPVPASTLSPRALRLLCYALQPSVEGRFSSPTCRKPPELPCQDISAFHHRHIADARCGPCRRCRLLD